jgi:EAL domain-containing protein (putative c-di-GMP-specific phosphodiesterase class I)
MADYSSRARHRKTCPRLATLYIAAPAAALALLRDALGRHSIESRDVFHGVLGVSFSDYQLLEIGSILTVTLAERDRGHTRCSIMPREEFPNASELMHSQSMDRFLSWVEGQWLGRLLRDARLLTYFQPIVDCRHPDRLFAHECLTRGQDSDGSLVPPDRLFATARATGQILELDRAARLRAIETVARLGVCQTAFINVNPHSILEPSECVEGALKAVLDRHLDPRQFVFEVVESDQIGDSPQLQTTLDHYREAGFRVALDDVGAGYNSLNLLASIKPDFVKIDRGLVHGIEQDRYKAHVAAKLLELSRDLGVRSVVEGIETESQWQWSRDHGADYAQGFFFGIPSAAPQLYGGQARPLDDVPESRLLTSDF